MRGIRKAQPPRDVSPQGQQRRSLQTAERQYRTELRVAADQTGCARAAFNGLDKRELRAVLYVEQGHLCVYCERRIAEGHPAPHIDHWRPLAANPQFALRWQNLYLSCADPATCDCCKQQRPLRADDGDPDLPWPVEHDYGYCVGFTSLAEIYVRSDAPLNPAQHQALARVIGVAHDDRTNDNGILNLNHPALVAARAAAIDGERERLNRRFRNRTASASEREEVAAERLRDVQLPAFVSIRVAWLRKALGVGR